MSLASKLRDARLQCGLNQDEVTGATDIGKSSVSEFETGKRDPSLSQLTSLARLYKKSVSYFLDENDADTPDHALVLWRERPQNAEAIERDFVDLCKRYRNLEVWCDDILSPDLPQVTDWPKNLSFMRVSDVARKVINELQLGEKPSFTLSRALEENCGVKIFCRDFQPTGAAAVIRSEDYGWAILLNSNNSIYRRSFDLAHELFHLLVWDCFPRIADSSGAVATETEEKLANHFASCLLMPEEAFRAAVEREQKDEHLDKLAVVDLARRFGVSIEALMWRIHALYLGPDHKDRTAETIKKLKDLQVQTNKPKEKSRPPSLPERYRFLAYKAYKDGQISAGVLAHYLETTRQDVIGGLLRDEAMANEVHLALA